MIVRNGQKLGSIIRDREVAEDEPSSAAAKPKASRKTAPKAPVKVEPKPEPAPEPTKAVVPAEPKGD